MSEKVKKCPICGKEMSDEEKFCPECGAEVIDEQYVVCYKCNHKNVLSSKFCTNCGATLTPQDNITINEKQNSPKKKKSKFGLIILAVLCFMLVRCAAGIFDDEEESQPKQTSIQDASIEVYAGKLLDNWADYQGKKIKTIVQFDFDSGSGKNARIHSKAIETEDGFHDYLDIYVAGKYKEDTYFEDEYLSVVGIVGDEGELNDASIISSGKDLEDTYNRDKEMYSIELIEKNAKLEDEFRNGELESPSYDDLIRYSDTYKNKKIKIKVYIEEAEADGVIFDGTIWGQYQGKQVIVRDNRKIKEPKIMTGDTLVIYGYGNGLNTIKTYVKGTGLFGSDLGAEVTDKTEVPEISVIYCDFK